MRARNIVIIILLVVASLVAAMLAMAWGPFQAMKADAMNKAMLVQASDLEGTWDASLDTKSKDNLDQVALRCEQALHLDEPAAHAAGSNFEVPRALIYSFAQTHADDAAVSKLRTTFDTTFARCVSSVLGMRATKLKTGFPSNTSTVRFVSATGYFDLTLAAQDTRVLFIAYSGTGRPATPGPVANVLEQRGI